MFAKLAKDGHRIVGVSMDAGNEARAKAAIEKHGATYPQLVLTAPSMKRAGLALENGLPFLLVVGADGKVRSEHSGKMDEEAVLAAIRAAR